jgi:bud site selection protein 31
LGCASGKAGFRNIFGNKYGQYLAEVQVAREKRAQVAAQLAADRVDAMAAAAEEEGGEDPAAAGEAAAPDSGDNVVDQAVSGAVTSCWEEGDADGAAEEAADAVLGHFVSVWAEEGELEEEDAASVLARTGQDIEVSASSDDMAALRAAMGGNSDGAGIQAEAVEPYGKKSRTE